jgi:hypothetical protein
MVLFSAGATPDSKVDSLSAQQAFIFFKSLSLFTGPAIALQRLHGMHSANR